MLSIHLTCRLLRVISFLVVASVNSQLLFTTKTDFDSDAMMMMRQTDPTKHKICAFFFCNNFPFPSSVKRVRDTDNLFFILFTTKKLHNRQVFMNVYFINSDISLALTASSFSNI